MQPRPSRTHVVIIDGTLSRLDEGDETNAGLLYKLLLDVGPSVAQSVRYDPGVQAEGLSKWLHIAAGIGVNRAILDGYAVLSSRYEPGDDIMIFGFSRGAYAARSLAGFIGRIGLIKRANATERRIQRAFRLYEAETIGAAASDFTSEFCHPEAPIKVLGVWDTVKALGLPYPILNRLAPMATEFHDHNLSPNTRNAFHALAIDENRASYEPLPWRISEGTTARVEQAWFPGAHADIGGQVAGVHRARTLSNIPLVWMLDRAEACGLILPDGWRDEFPCDAAAPMHGAYRGSAKLFVARKPRVVGRCSSEFVHVSVAERQHKLPRYRPRALITRTISETATRAAPRPSPEAPDRPEQNGLQSAATAKPATQD